jgi:hypothetical protein
MRSLLRERIVVRKLAELDDTAALGFGNDGT